MGPARRDAAVPAPAAALSCGLGVLVALLAGTFLSERSALLASGRPDLGVYLAGARILAGPRPSLLYDWAEQQREQSDWPGPSTPYVNPPFVALLFVPLLPVSRLTAFTVTAAAEAALLVAAMFLAARLARLRPWQLLALAALAHPITLLVWFSVQPAPLVTLAWAGFALMWVLDRRAAAVGWLLLGLAVKPHLMLAPVAFTLVAAEGRPRLLLAGGIVALGLIAWAMVGTTGVEHYPRLLRTVALSGHTAVNAAGMPNLRGLLAGMFGDHAWSRGLSAAAAIGIVVGAVIAGRTPQGSVEQRATALMTILAGTLAASYHLHLQELNGLFILLCLAAAAGWVSRGRLPGLAVGLVASLWLLFFLPPFAPGLLTAILLLLFCLSLRKCLRPVGVATTATGRREGC